MSDQHLTRWEIVTFIEGVVDPTDIAVMGTHIADCRNCTDLFHELLAFSVNETSVPEQRRTHPLPAGDAGADGVKNVRLDELQLHGDGQLRVKRP